MSYSTALQLCDDELLSTGYNAEEEVVEVCHDQSPVKRVLIRCLWQGHDVWR